MLLYAEYECDRHRAIALQKQGEEMLRCAKFEQKRILRSMSRIKTLLDEECPGWEICKP